MNNLMNMQLSGLKLHLYPCSILVDVNWTNSSKKQIEMKSLKYVNRPALYSCWIKTIVTRSIGGRLLVNFLHVVLRISLEVTNAVILCNCLFSVIHFSTSVNLYYQKNIFGPEIRSEIQKSEI